MSKKWEEEVAYFEAHRRDPNEWGEPIEAPVAAPRRNGLGVTITVRFQADDADALRRTAALEEATYSEVVRKAVLRYVQPNHTFEANHEYAFPAFADDAPRTVANPSPPPALSIATRPITRSSAVAHDALPAE